MAKRDEIPLQTEDLFEQLCEHLKNNDLEALRDLAEEIEGLREWLTLDNFDRRAVNRRLKQYAANDEAWMWE